MSPVPEFSDWLQDQRQGSGLTVRSISLQAGLSTTAVKDALRGVPPGAKTVNRLGELFGADAIWLAAWLATTHLRHVAGGRASATAHGPQSVPDHVFEALKTISADPSRPPWSRWLAERMVESGLSRHALDRALGEPILRQQIGRLLDGTAVPAVKTLARLGAVLGPVPDDVFNAAGSARRDQNMVSQATRKDRVRRWQKAQLVTHIQGWFGAEALPRAIKSELARLDHGHPVGVAGFRILLKAQTIRMQRSIDPKYTPVGPGSLGPQPRLVVRRALIGLRRQSQRGGLDLRICETCNELTILPHVYASRPWRGRCGACWLAFTRSADGHQWAWEVQAAQRSEDPVPRPSPARRSRRGPIPDVDRAAAGLIRTLEQALGEAEPDSTGEEGRVARNAERLLRASSTRRCRELVAALDRLGRTHVKPSQQSPV